MTAISGMGESGRGLGKTRARLLGKERAGRRPAPTTATFPKGRQGFTLIEIMVAMAVGGLVLLGATALLESVTDIADRLTTVTVAEQRDANADRLLHTLFARIEVGTPWSHTFGGDARTVQFSTWCNVPSGRLAPCDARVSFERRDDSLSLVLRVEPFSSHAGFGPATVVLQRGFSSGTLRYINDPDAGGQWFVAWGDAIVTPIAVGVIIDGDTTILRVRG